MLVTPGSLGVKGLNLHLNIKDLHIFVLIIFLVFFFNIF